MIRNPVLGKLNRNEVVTCAWMTMGSPLMVEMIVQEGCFDCILLDAQHGFWNEENTLLAALHTTLNSGTVPFVRVPSNNFAQIGRALDLGALGLIIPLVNSAEEAVRAVEAMRSPPAGKRSMGGFRIKYYGEDAFLAEATKQLVCAVMIETVQAVERAEDILSVPGVDMGFIGPGDLAFSMGLFPNRGPKHEEALLKVLAASQRAGKPLGILCMALDEIFKRAEQGFRFLPQFVDSRAFQESVRAHAKEVREGLAALKR
jgi:2-keto-3-deoxy-L-rhamnonate aldolase RhmA